MATVPAVELAGFLRRHAVRITVQAAVVAAAAGLLSLLLPDKYTAATVLLPPNPQADLGGLLSGAAGGAALSRALGIDAQNEIDVYLGVLRSDHVNQALLRRFHLQQVYRQKDVEKAGKRLKSHTGITLTNEGFPHRRVLLFFIPVVLEYTSELFIIGYIDSLSIPIDCFESSIRE